MSKSELTQITRRSFIEKSIISTAGLALSPAYANIATPGHENKRTSLMDIKLGQPDINKGIPIMQALKKRRSIRDLQSKKLSHQHLSEILWAADGVNREDGKRTAPSAMNLNIVETYAILEEGIYIYDHDNHRLISKIEGDFREFSGEQESIFKAPFNLVYVANLEKFENQQSSFTLDQMMIWAAIEAGCQAENVYLYCTSERLGALIRASMKFEKFSEALNFNDLQKFISIQTIGYQL